MYEVTLTRKDGQEITLFGDPYSETEWIRFAGFLRQIRNSSHDEAAWVRAAARFQSWATGKAIIAAALAAREKAELCVCSSCGMCSAHYAHTGYLTFDSVGIYRV